MNLKAPKEIKKIAFFTDIHFGKKSNSKIHNQDCLDFINWFCDNVKKDKSITHIGFLGDWYESRSAINIETLDFSRKAVQILDQLNIPIFFIVGNHDLHRRTTRDVHSVKIFDELKNFTVIDHPQVIDNILFSPYLFEDEYKDLIKYNDLWCFAGHFEFSNFYITGYNTLMIGGPDHKMFNGPKRIFSGHFHKRQANDNVVYIGNTFPMDAGDAGDTERGMCTYDTLSDKINFINWNDCPKYEKISLSKLYDGIENNTLSFGSKTKVKCIVDIDITYSDAQSIKDDMINTFNLRDFILEENKMAQQDLLENGTDSIIEESSTIDELVANQLESLENEKSLNNIDIKTLIQIYKDLPLDLAENE